MTKWRLTFLFVSINLLAVSLGQKDVPAGCEEVTTSGYKYSKFWHLPTRPTGEHELRFRIKARSDAHIVLTTSPIVVNPLYEIVLGATNNNFTDLRRSAMGKSVSAHRTPSILSDKEYRGFWINVRSDQGEIEIGLEGESTPYFHWKDPEPLAVHYYSFSTWTNTIGKWMHKCDFGGNGAWSAARGSVSNDSSELTTGLRPGDEILFFSDIEKLRYNLFQVNHYNKDTRPAPAHRDSVQLAMGLTLQHFDLDELSSVFTVHSWMKFSWVDSRLRWNTSDYDGLGVIHIPAHNVWLPDIVLYNNAEANDHDHYSEVNVLVYPDGSVLWVPAATFRGRCQMDLRNWPYDEQICTLKFGSWSHDGFKLDMTLSGNSSEIDNDDYSSNLRWALVSANATREVAYYSCCEEPYPSITMFFKLKRQSPAYGAGIITPAVVIMMLILSTFLLPTCSVHRILIGLFCLVVVSLFILYFSLILPAMGDHLPVIVRFYSDMLVMIGFSIVVNTILVTLASRSTSLGLPSVLRNLLTGPLGTVLCLEQATVSRKHNRLDSDLQARELNIATDLDEEEKTATFSGKASSDGLRGEWRLLASAIDRIAFIACGISFAILAASCF